MRTICVSLFLIAMTISGCAVRTPPTHHSKCGDYKIIRQERVSTSNETAKAMIYGITMDNTMTIVYGVNVMVTDANGKQTGVMSGTFGEYQIQLDPGTYQVRFNRASFCDLTLRDIVIGKGEVWDITVGLDIQSSH